MGTPMSKRYMTEAGLMNLEDESCRHELVAGVIVAEPFPTHRHDRTVRRLLRIVGDFVEAHGLGEVFGESGYVLARDPDTVRGPDLSFISRARLANFDDARFFSGAPDLAVEIRPPRIAGRNARQRSPTILPRGRGWCGLSIPSGSRSRPIGRCSPLDDSNQTRRSTARTFFRAW